MATEEYTAFAPSEKLKANLQRIEDLTQRLVAASLRKQSHDKALDGPAPELFGNAASAWLNGAIANPAKLVEQQAAWWGKTLAHYAEAQKLLASGKISASKETKSSDRRFSNPLWNTHPWFSYLKQQYEMNAEALQRGIEGIDSLDPKDRKRIEYFTRQLVDMMAPTNFFGTNPDALERAVETEGESLVRGLENLVRDLEANDGELLVTLSDPAAFEVGRNIGASEGSVVFRNEILELIQFAPTTDKVHRTPLLIFPPWINKFYILDLKPANSLIKWVVDQGFTLFVVSWKNPDARYANFGMDDYLVRGYLEAIKAVKEITGEKQINAVGYCIAGTTLSLLLSLLAQTGDKSIRSATFFTTLTDFSDQGEFTPFLTDDFVDGIARESAEKGYLSSRIMSRTFSFLRSNDLIWQPAIRSYMLGEPPPAFDLLHWNGDGTNLPGKMVVDYLRKLCQEDRFAKGAYPFGSILLKPQDIKLPICAIACETDHIAAWRASYAGFQRFGSKDKTFILSQSGHIAGIINPPGKEKYGHYTSDAALDAQPADGWLKEADFSKGSWWPRWAEWLAKNSGAKVAARVAGTVEGYPVLAAAPGTYVLREPAVKT